MQPKATVIVVTSQALKLHGGVPASDISKPNLEGLKNGLENLEKHVSNIQSFGQSVVIGFNQYGFDTEEELNYMRQWSQEHNAIFAINNGFSQGGEGAEELAQAVIDTVENRPSQPLQFTYDLEDDIATKKWLQKFMEPKR